MKKTKQSFSDFIKALPPLKKLTKETKLPHYYDLMWDCKIGEDLMCPVFKYLNREDVLRRLAEDGFDIKALTFKK